MTKHRNEKGFTLVELAIVMTIIGLLIGGILKGQELMENARVTATIAQVKSYEAATTTFRDSFSAKPGDMVNAATRIPNCAPAAACNALAGTPGAGDDIIGAVAGLAVAQPAPTGAAPTSVQAESVLFWTHMLLANLIAGVSDAGLRASACATGETHPSAKIGGAFRVANGDGTVPPGSPAAAGTGPSGMILVLAGAPCAAIAAAPVAGQQPMTPGKAAQIDRKVDDGKARSGFVQSYGVQASCFTGGPNNDSYNETLTSKDCGLVFQIQG